MSRWPGDWNCCRCQHLNFGRRDSCQQCGDRRSIMDVGGHGVPPLSLSPEAARPGDWYCLCGGHNFANRPSCHLCGAGKESAVGYMPSSLPLTADQWKSGDWLCTRSGCYQHNFASRRDCFRCKAPRGCGT